MQGAGLELDGHGLVRRTSEPTLARGVAPSVPEALEQAAAREADRVVLVDGETRLTCRDLHEEAEAVARGLAELGLGPGDRVAASMRNRAELVVAFFAVLRLGCLWVGINRGLAPAEKRRLLSDCAAAALIVDGESADEAGELTRGTAVGTVVVADPEGDWPRLLEGQSATLPPVPRAGSPAAIAYTSGTSGLPKGVVHSHRNLLLPAAVAGELGVARGHRIGVCLPLTILNFQILGPLSALVGGGAVVVGRRTDPEGLAAWVRAHRVSAMSAVPTIYHDLAESPQVRPGDLRSLTVAIVGGSSCTEELRARVAERFGLRLLAGYGLTEVPTSVARERPELPHVEGSTGPVLPHVEVAVVDDDGAPVPAGEEGEIVVSPARSGPFAGTYTPMLGYWGKPEETCKALAGGVLHTGDIGRFDDAGNLFVRGRRSEVIVRGGAKIHPAEVERVLLDDPRVQAAAVVGVPDERLGQVVAAFVELAPGASATDAELVGHCRAHLSRTKVPELLVVLGALPRNAMGKVDKPALVELAEGRRSPRVSR